MRRDTAAWVAGAAFAATVTSLLALSAGVFGSSARPPWPAALVAAWFYANLFVWMAPTWRINVIYQRGRTLGIGFALAGTLLATVAAWGRWPVHPALFALSWLAALGAPFALALALRAQPGEPAWWDGVVLACALALDLSDQLSLPLAGGPWPIGTLDLGRVAVTALLATYFFGVRQWQEIGIYWWPDRRDVLAGALAGLLGLAVLLPAALAAGWLAWKPVPWGAAWWASLAYLTGGVAAAQETVWRGIVQPALCRLLPGAPAAAVAATAALEAAVQVLARPSGATAVEAAAVAWVTGLACGWATYRRQRLFPAVLARALVLAVTRLLFARPG